MADSGRHEAALPDFGFDGVAVPFIFVPEGQTPCPKWMAEHPEAFPVPAVFVPSCGGRDASMSELDREGDETKEAHAGASANIVPIATANDPQGIEMARAAARAGGLRTNEEFEIFHDEFLEKE